MKNKMKLSNMEGFCYSQEEWENRYAVSLTDRNRKQEPSFLWLLPVVLLLLGGNVFSQTTFKLWREANNFGLIMDESGHLTFSNGTAIPGSDLERMRITTGGNVGIGTSTPGYTLEVAGAVNADSLLIDGTPIKESQWVSGGADIHYAEGSVGIGTSTPDYTLDVAGTVNADNLLIDGTPVKESQWVSGGADIHYTGGDVGIGTSTPEYALDVVGTVNADNLLIDGNPLPESQWSSEGSDIYYAGGEVGIGTAEPLAKLQVSDGDVYISDVNQGIIMKSPSGTCWRGTVSNLGFLRFRRVECPEEGLTSKGAREASPSASGLAESNVLLFPNPAEETITIRLMNDTEQQQTEYAISGMDGTLIKKGKIKSEGSNDYRLDISSLKTGSYILSVSDINGQVLSTHKIMKK